MTLEIIKDEKTGVEIAYIVNDDGTTVSMLKSTYDEQLKAAKAAKLNEPVTQPE